MTASNDQMLLAQMRAQSEFELTKLRSTPAYLLCLFLGGLGVHRFYLGRTGSGAALLVLWLLSWPLMAVGVGFLTLTAALVWAVVDLFLIAGMLQQANVTRWVLAQQRNGIPVPVAPGYLPTGYHPAPTTLQPHPFQPAPVAYQPAPALPAAPQGAPPQPAPGGSHPM